MGKKKGFNFESSKSKKKRTNSKDSTIIQRIRILNGAIVGGIALLGSLALITIYSGNQAIGISEYGIITILLLSIILSRVKRTGITSVVAVLAMLAMSMLLIITGGFQNTGLFWIFTFPIVAFSLEGGNKGALWVAILFLLFGTIDMLETLNIVTIPYPPFSIKIFRITLLIVSALIFIYEKTQEMVQTLIKNQADNIKEINKKINREKKKLSTILYGIGDGVLVLDEKKKIIIVNEIARKLSGYKEKELLGMPYKEKLKFIYEKDKKDNYKFIEDVYKHGKITKMDKPTVLIRKNKKEQPISVSAAPLKGRSKRVKGCVVVFKDVTKEREIDRMKTEFVSITSHQLKTPITSINWSLDLLKDEGFGKLTKKQEELVDEMHDTNRKMSILINDLLNVSRIDRGEKFNIEKKDTDIVPLIDESINEEKVQAVKKKVKVVKDKSLPKKLVLFVDGDKVKQLLQNLINNAVKYSKDNGLVEIGLKMNEENRITLYVKDNGIGIPEEQQKRLFEKFYRAENVTKLNIEGTGLGLYIASAIAKGHGGNIWFESKEGKGTTFYVSLPKKGK